MESKSAIPVRKITVKLKKTDPTRLTPEELQKQMYGIGLKCKDTSIDNLFDYKEDLPYVDPRGRNRSVRRV